MYGLLLKHNKRHPIAFHFGGALMKKAIALLLILSIILGMTSCGIVQRTVPLGQVLLRCFFREI